MDWVRPLHVCGPAARCPHFFHFAAPTPLVCCFALPRIGGSAFARTPRRAGRPLLRRPVIQVALGLCLQWVERGHKTWGAVSIHGESYSVTHIAKQLRFPGKRQRRLTQMFLVSDTLQGRRRIIRSFEDKQSTLGVLLAVVDFEWTVRRAIIALAYLPTKHVRADIERCSGPQKYLEKWHYHVSPSGSGRWTRWCRTGRH